MDSVFSMINEEMLAVSMFFAIWDSIWPYLMMIMGFSVIIFVHELGHFMVAKWADVRVDRFAVGFGREIIGFTRGQTRYSLNMLPFGGYVKMLGQEDFDDKSEELKFNDDPSSFVNKPISHRMAIVSAGVIMNVLFACLLFMIVFRVGRESITTRIAYIEPDSPAERAGLLPGDDIREINGARILEFDEVRMAVLLSEMHEPLAFTVERDGELKTIAVEPDYRLPRNTRDPRRQMVGISPSITRKIVRFGPEIDETREDHPHLGDMIVEIDGIEITDENASKMIHMLAYAKGDVVVERSDPDNPDAPPRRVHVTVPPNLTLYPSGPSGHRDINVLGLIPLSRFDRVSERGRAKLAGLEKSDTILMWDDISYPSRKRIERSIQECPERDISFRVRKADGQIKNGFVRPEQLSKGLATIGAIYEPIPKDRLVSGGPKARFADVRSKGIADQAHFEAGDEVIAVGTTKHPTLAEINKTIWTSTDSKVYIKVRKADGSTHGAWMVPQERGTINARINLVAHDILRIGGIIPTLNGTPSPAAQAGLMSGSLITAVNDQPVTTWRELINQFRSHAGESVRLSYRDGTTQTKTTSFPVPISLRTMLGVGPESRIVSVDGQKTVRMQTARGMENVSVGYRRGTYEILSRLVGRSDVEVTFRRNALSDLETKQIMVTEAMLDPWVGRIAFSPNIDVAPETMLLKGDTLLEALSIGLHKTYYIILQVYKTMERMIISKSVGVENIQGPLGIIDIGGKVARAGWVDFTFFLAIISANLAVINFLPLPIVDGGLMVFLIIEKIKGSPVSLKIQAFTQIIGVCLILSMFALVTFNDVVRMWG